MDRREASENRDAVGDGEERDDYVFVEGRESDESSLDDLHVVDGVDPSGNDSPLGNAGELRSADADAMSESFVEIHRGGEDRSVDGEDEIGDEPDALVVQSQELLSHSGVVGERADPGFEFEGSRLGRGGFVEGSDIGVMGGIDGNAEDVDVAKVEEGGNDELVVNAVPFAVSSQENVDVDMRGSSVGSMSLEEGKGELEEKMIPDPVEGGDGAADARVDMGSTREDSFVRSGELEGELGVGVVDAKVDSHVEVGGYVGVEEERNAELVLAQHEIVDTMMQSHTLEEEKTVDEVIGVGVESRELCQDGADVSEERNETSDETQCRSVECEESMNEPDNSVSEEEGLGLKQGPSEIESLPEKDCEMVVKNIEDPQDVEIGEENNAETMVPAVPSVLSQAKTDETIDQCFSSESCLTEEETGAEPVVLVEIDENFHGETSLQESQVHKEQTDSSSICDADSSSIHDASQIENPSTGKYDEIESESGIGVVIGSASVQMPSSKHEHETMDMNIEDARDDTLEERKGSVLATEMLNRPTFEEPDDTEKPTLEHLHLEQERIVTRAVVQVGTDEESIPETFESSMNNDKVPREQSSPDSELGTLKEDNISEQLVRSIKHEASEPECSKEVDVAGLHQESYTLDDDNIESEGGDKRENAESADSVTIEQMAATEQGVSFPMSSSSLETSHIDEEKLVTEVDLLSGIDEESCQEYMEDSGPSTDIGHIPRELDNTTPSYRSVPDEVKITNELASSSTEALKMDVGIPEASGFIHQAPKNMESFMHGNNAKDEGLEVTEHNDAKEEKDNQLKSEVSVKASERDFDAIAEQSSPLESVPSVDMENPVYEPSTEIRTEVIENVEEDRDNEVRDIEGHSEVPPIRIENSENVTGDDGTAVDANVDSLVSSGSLLPIVSETGISSHISIEEDGVVSVSSKVDRSMPETFKSVYDINVVDPSPSPSVYQASRELALDGDPQNLSIPENPSVSKADDQNDVSKEDSLTEDTSEDSPSHTTQVADNLGKDTRLYIVRLRRNQVEELALQIELAQLQIEEKTQSRDSIRTMILRQKDVCEEVWKSVEDARKEEKTARQAVDAKYQELRNMREKTEMIELAYSIDDTDERMNTLKHRMQHETIPLKEEKQLLQKMRELKHKRGDLSSKLASQAEMKEAFEQKDQIEAHLKRLGPELDSLKKELSHAEMKAKAAKKKYDDQYLILRNLQAQHRTADELRQAAYANLRALRKELYEKNKHFYKYKDDARAAVNISSSGDKEALQRHSHNQIERFMELWNKNDEFRAQYVNVNQFSTVKRFGTLDGRSLGPDEEPYVLPLAPSKSPNAENLPSTRNNTTQPIERKEDREVEVAMSAKTDEPPIKVQEKTVKKEKPQKISKPELKQVTALVSYEQPDKEAEETERTNIKEDESKRMADELARKEEEEEKMRKREQEAEELKEKIRLEQIAKAREAEERKRRKADKAKAIAEMRAQREAELKEKKKAKKERLKEKKATGKADADVGTTEVVESVPDSPPEAFEIPEVKVSRSLPAASKQPQHSKRKPLPPPLRNKGKSKLQTWMLVIGSTVIVAVLFLLGNFTSLGRSKSFGF